MSRRPPKEDEGLACSTYWSGSCVCILKYTCAHLYIRMGIHYMHTFVYMIQLHTVSLCTTMCIYIYIHHYIHILYCIILFTHVLHTIIWLAKVAKVAVLGWKIGWSIPKSVPWSLKNCPTPIWYGSVVGGNVQTTNLYQVTLDQKDRRVVNFILSQK